MKFFAIDRDHMQAPTTLAWHGNVWSGAGRALFNSFDAGA